MSKSAFERYAPFIQEYIYRKKWTDLREVQVEACEAILDTNKHVIVASGTASGKTEAAFFPILTLLDQNPSDSIGVMYIGPLKALINDQFERLNDLLEEVDIPVWSWHGDVSQSHKKKALKTAKGVLQITPESLEALIMKHPGDASRLFSDLRFIVIDEIHALMGEDRGLQVLCLINRLEKLTGCTPRRVGLSATLNDYEPAMAFLSAGSAVPSLAVGIQAHKRTLSLCVESFTIPKEEDKAQTALSTYNSFLYDNCHSKKCLIFTNSRSGAEKTIDDMKKEALKRNEPDVFYVHHGSISASLRKEAEEALRDNKGPTVAAATLTLELGIDIGDLDSTIQVGAPYRCSSFVQRLGRSGRRTGKSQMMFLDLHKDVGKNPLDSMPWDLLRSIAIIQLYLEDRWVEPFEQKKKPFSLLAHQTLSVLMANGELSPAELARNVLLLPAFKDCISADEYRALLKYMIEKEYLQRMDNGGIIVGLKGEKICNFYSFYAIFQDEETYKVMSSFGEVGSLNKCPAMGEVFILAGRSWVVISIDEERKTIHVNQAKSNRIPSWDGEGGNIHTKVVQRMKKVLQEDKVYPYLQKNAIDVLTQAREMARMSGILEHDVIAYADKSYYICPWIGSKQLYTIANLLAYGFKSKLDIRSISTTKFYLSITSGLDKSELIKTAETLTCEMSNPDLVLNEEQAPRIDKYDYMVPNELLRSAYLYNQVDVPVAIDTLNNLNWL